MEKSNKIQPSAFSSQKLERSGPPQAERDQNPKFPLKVLFLTHCFIRNKDDFAGAFLFDLAKGLKNKGIDITVLAPHSKGLPKYEEIDNIKIYRFQYAPEKYEYLAYKSNMHEIVAKGFFSKLIFFSFAFYFFKNAIDITKKHNIKIIHSHWWVPAGVIGLVVGKLSGKPYVVTSHGTDISLLAKIKLARPLAKIIFKNSIGITAVSNNMKSFMVNKLGINENKVSVFPMPVNPSIFSPMPVENRGEKIILSVGNFIELKGFSYLISAIKILKEQKVKIKLIIIGGGPEEKTLKQKIKELSLNENIEILPSMTKTELNHFYNVCDIFVLPSITDSKGKQEGLGLVLLEAMSCKKPVIGTNSGGIPDIVKDMETGLVVPEKDSKSLSEAIGKLLKDDSLSTKLAENGYNFVKQNFTLDKIAEKTLEVYRKS
ncbi:MAG: glycosyltransferase family 4 protein [bacterium]|nr:glycosyltransferase family 4 protein [bacterium]